MEEFYTQLENESCLNQNKHIFHYSAILNQDELDTVKQDINDNIDKIFSLLKLKESNQRYIKYKIDSQELLNITGVDAHINSEIQTYEDLKESDDNELDEYNSIEEFIDAVENDYCEYVANRLQDIFIKSTDKYNIMVTWKYVSYLNYVYYVYFIFK